jgi:hypothetical protein
MPSLVRNVLVHAKVLSPLAVRPTIPTQRRKFRGSVPPEFIPCAMSRLEIKTFHFSLTTNLIAPPRLRGAHISVENLKLKALVLAFNMQPIFKMRNKGL